MNADYQMLRAHCIRAVWAASCKAVNHSKPKTLTLGYFPPVVSEAETRPRQIFLNDLEIPQLHPSLHPSIPSPA